MKLSEEAKLLLKLLGLAYVSIFALANVHYFIMMQLGSPFEYSWVIVLTLPLPITSTAVVKLH